MQYLEIPMNSSHLLMYVFMMGNWKFPDIRCGMSQNNSKFDKIDTCVFEFMLLFSKWKILFHAAGMLEVKLNRYLRYVK